MTTTTSPSSQPADGTVIGYLRGEGLDMREGRNHGRTYRVLLIADSRSGVTRGVGGVRYSLRRQYVG